MSPTQFQLYARCTINGELYRVDFQNKVGERYTLRPVDMQPYQFLAVTAEQLQNRNLFVLFPLYRTAPRIAVSIPAQVTQ